MTNTNTTSSLLLKTASFTFASASIIHTYFSFANIFPKVGLSSRVFETYTLKNVFIQIGGYWIINSLLLWRWATNGVNDSYDGAMMGVLVGMNTIGGVDFLRRGFVKGPPPALLLGTSALIVASQLV